MILWVEFALIFHLEGIFFSQMKKKSTKRNMFPTLFFCCVKKTDNYYTRKSVYRLNLIITTGKAVWHFLEKVRTDGEMKERN